MAYAFTLSIVMSNFCCFNPFPSLSVHSYSHCMYNKQLLFMEWQWINLECDVVIVVVVVAFSSILFKRYFWDEISSHSFSSYSRENMHGFYKLNKKKETLFVALFLFYLELFQLFFLLKPVFFFVWYCLVSFLFSFLGKRNNTHSHIYLYIYSNFNYSFHLSSGLTMNLSILLGTCKRITLYASKANEITNETDW